MEQTKNVSPRKQMAMGKKINPLGPTAKNPVAKSGKKAKYTK